jgi:hypothetical protein
MKPNLKNPYFTEKLLRFKKIVKRQKNSSGGWGTVSDDTLDK